MRPTGIVSRYYPIVREYSLNAGKQFFPGGPRIQIGTFQKQFASIRGKIRFAEGTFEINNRTCNVYLGSRLMIEIPQLARYLYDNAIDPEFFANAINAIASHPIILRPEIKKIQLLNLARDHIQLALDTGQISTNDIGNNYQTFNNSTLQEKIDFLIKLKIFEFKKPEEMAPIQQAPTPPPPSPRQKEFLFSLRHDPKKKP